MSSPTYTYANVVGKFLFKYINTLYTDNYLDILYNASNYGTYYFDNKNYTLTASRTTTGGKYKYYVYNLLSSGI